MSELSAWQSVLLIGEALIASSLAMLLAYAVTARLREQASLRHLIWLSAFAALLLVPLLAALLPGLTPVTLSAPAPVAALPPLPEPRAMLHTAPAQGFEFDLGFALRLLALVWLAGLAVLAWRAAIAQVGLYRLRRASVAFHASDIRIGAAGPLTFGIARPVILLPEAALDWPEARLDAVLAHERAHVRRGDCAAQAFAYLVCALYWPNPLVWWGAAALRREAEMAADDAVLAAGIKPSDYAGELLTIAASFAAPALAAPFHMAAPSSLRMRVAAILSPQAHRTGVTPMHVAKISVAVLMASTALVLARPSLAQEALPPVPQAPVSSDVPSVPSVPAAPATPAIAAPPAVPAPPAEPAPSAKPHVSVHREVRTENGKTTQRIIVTTDGMEKVVAPALADLGPDVERVIAESQPQIEKAMSEARRAQPEMQKAMAALKAAEPKIRAALAKMREELAKANISLHIHQKTDGANGKTELKIELDNPEDKTGASVVDGPSDGH